VVAVLGAAGLLLVLVTWAASIGPDRVASGGRVERIRPDEPTAATEPADGAVDPAERARRAERGEPPGWVGAVAFVLEALTVVVVAFLVWRLLRRLRGSWRRRTRRRRAPPVEVDFEVLGTPAHVSQVIEADAPGQRASLAEEGEPRNAIVACWHRFEQQAVRGGVERRPWQTTAEFVLEVLDLVAADRGAVARLADLYREARFSDHPMTGAHRHAALDALDGIHRSLGRAVAR
jgi:hypothetical protein